MDRCHSCNLAMGPHMGSRSWHSRDPESSSSEGEGHLRKTGTDWGLVALEVSWDLRFLPSHLCLRVLRPGS